MTRAASQESPALMDVQFAAPFVVLKIPAAVPAYRVVGESGSIARALTTVCVAPPRPELTIVQVAPPSVVLRTPDPVVPAYAVAGAIGSITSVTTLAPSGPVAVQLLTPGGTGGI